MLEYSLRQNRSQLEYRVSIKNVIHSFDDNETQVGIK